MKKWFDPFLTAFSGVITHKLRSFLTMLGIVIGVASVIALMSIGNGAEQQVLTNIQSLGANLVRVQPAFGSSSERVSSGLVGVTVKRAVPASIGGSITLTVEDADAIAQLPHVAAVSPVYTNQVQLNVNGENTGAQLIGAYPDGFQINNLKVAEGSLFTAIDYANAENVIVLGSNVAATLFPNSDPVGQVVRMGNVIVHVIGVLQQRGTSVDSVDDAVYTPLTTMQKTLAQPRTAQGDRVVSQITLTVDNQADTQVVIDEVTSLLRTRHRLAATAQNDFFIQSAQDLANSVSQAIKSFTLLLGAIAGISLLVGGIGVMNIMLVSVLERTREIGIRKALGAKQHDIWGQFLIEAAFLSLAGGVIGVAIGGVVSYIVSRLGLVPTLVTPGVVVLAVSVAVGIGLFFGFYPAWNAARLDPIEALRAE